MSADRHDPEESRLGLNIYNMVAEFDEVGGRAASLSMLKGSFTGLLSPLEIAEAETPRLKSL